MQNSTILFLTSSELGQASLSLAVAHEFLLRPSYDVHIASFASLERSVSQVNARAASLPSAASIVTFHPITGPSIKEAYVQHGLFVDPFDTHGIGFRKALATYKNPFPRLANPWDGPEYMTIFQDCVATIRKLQPAIVVVDPLFTPAVEACGMVPEQRYVALSPNTFKELVPQPRLKNLWKYPILASGYPYPLPWRLVPQNAYLAIQAGRILAASSEHQNLTKYRNSHGLPGPIPGTVPPNIPTLLSTKPEIEFPCLLPDNFTLCGPILRPCSPIAEENAELATWLAQRPTVLVNLGSHVIYTSEQVQEFMEGIHILLDRRPDIQILWKIMPRPGTAIAEIMPDLNGTAGRVRIETWLPVEPICILRSGHVHCVVHHGGSNSYHEAVSAGVPQVILPLWFDTYDYAGRAEWLGIGVWGSRKTAPAVNGPKLGQALIRVLASDKTTPMRERAKSIASQLGPKEGRVIACEKIISLLAEPLPKVHESVKKSV